jgi:hypothetical protein
MLVEKRTSLLRLTTTDGTNAWYLVSRLNDNRTMRLRRIPLDPDGRFEDFGAAPGPCAVAEIARKYHASQSYVGIKICEEVTSLPIDMLPLSEPTAWPVVIERLERHLLDSSQPALVADPFYTVVRGHEPKVKS